MKKPRQRIPVALLFCTFIGMYFYLLVVKAYETDITAHLLFAASYFGGDVSLPHPLFAVCVLPVYWTFSLVAAGKAVAALSGLDLSRFAAFVAKDFKKYTGKYGVPIDLGGYDLYSLLDLHLAGIFVIAASLTVCFVLSRQVIARCNERQGVAPLLAIVAMSCSALYLPAFNHYAYLGQGSPNIWHSPTILLLKPFAVLTVILFCRFTPFAQNPADVKRLALAGAVLTLTGLIKPNFPLVFIPAVILYLLLTGERSPALWGRIGLSLAPAAAVLGYQYLSTYASAATQNSQVVISFLQVWRLYTPNVFISLLLALCFPLAVLLIRGRRIVETNPGLCLAWLITGTGILQAAFLAETGPRFPDANFMWGYIISLYLLFLFSLAEYARMLDEICARGPMALTVWRQQRPLAVATVLLLLHFFSGIIYLFRIFSGQGYY